VPAQLLSHCQCLTSVVPGSSRESWLGLGLPPAHDHFLPSPLSNHILPPPMEPSCQDPLGGGDTPLSPAVARPTQCRGTLAAAAAAAVPTCHRSEVLSLSSDARGKKKKSIKKFWEVSASACDSTTASRRHSQPHTHAQLPLHLTSFCSKEPVTPTVAPTHGLPGRDILPAPTTLETHQILLLPLDPLPGHPSEDQSIPVIESSQIKLHNSHWGRSTEAACHAQMLSWLQFVQLGYQTSPEDSILQIVQDL